ncbi:FAD-dependent oxidoreductase [Kitasatospora sp. NPDC059648]|uniref:FAD-dependent oxidoreductase n=1 Tax=Kitasatospora sp. NPDC059648 TaxID=3346894 RepID=UPI0036747FDB
MISHGTDFHGTGTDVLIVGAGPTGLALALDLARHGVRALLVERGPELFPGSRGKGLQPRTLEVLEDFGVLADLRATAGHYPPNLFWRDGEPQGERLMYEPTEPSEAEPYTETLMVPQWRTQQVLYRRLRELGGEVAFGRELTSLTQDEDGVTAGFTAGGPVRARYTVAADGGRSTVRRLLGIGMTGETVDPGPMLVADVRVSGLGRDHWHVFRAEQGLLAICPLAGTEDFQLVAQFPEGAAVDLSLEAVRAVVAERSHLTAEQIGALHWASEFRPRAALADSFRSGRVFLAGDAAHVHSPAGAQGLNTSVQDAYNLGWKLAAVLSGRADTALLDSYQEERRANAAAMLELSTKVHRGVVRRGRATQQLGLGYRESALAVDTRPAHAADALRAGDRAPDGRRGGTRLFDSFRGPHWTLLTVGTDAELPPLDVPVVRIPSYEAYGDGVFLIRPDGYVGWAGETAEGLAGYAARCGVAGR